MDEKSLFTDFWNKESKTTSKVLGRIPEGSDYRPDPKSRTAREIAWQIVGEEKMLIDALEIGKVTWAPLPPPETIKELCEAYDTQRADIERRWQSLPLTRWNGTLDFSASSARQRRWPGAFSSISFTTAARSRLTCVQWDQPSRRSTVRALTSRRSPPLLYAS
jgi:hypothetical protein